MGLDAGESVSLLGKFSEAGIESQDALKAMSKAAQKYSKDGKNVAEGLADLGNQLLNGALQKMSDSSFSVLQAANVDINAIVTGAGEALIAKMKKTEQEEHNDGNR